MGYNFADLSKKFSHSGKGCDSWDLQGPSRVTAEIHAVRQHKGDTPFDCAKGARCSTAQDPARHLRAGSFCFSAVFNFTTRTLSCSTASKSNFNRSTVRQD